MKVFLKILVFQFICSSFGGNLGLFLGMGFLTFVVGFLTGFFNFDLSRSYIFTFQLVRSFARSLVHSLTPVAPTGNKQNVPNFNTEPALKRKTIN
jgi:hypothetical protein